MVPLVQRLGCAPQQKSRQKGAGLKDQGAEGGEGGDREDKSTGANVSYRI